MNSKTFKLDLDDIDVEACCEECGEPIHTHFNCPVCKKDGAGTDCYGSLIDEFNDGDISFKCESCGAEFLIILIDSENNEMVIELQEL